MIELGKGKFYLKEDVTNQLNIIHQARLKILRGFKFTIISMNKDLSFIQLDICSRILRTGNFLDEINNQNQSLTNSAFNLAYKGATVIARYGNHKTYKIESIHTELSPLSTFAIKKKDSAPMVISYKDYFYQCYGI